MHRALGKSEKQNDLIKLFWVFGLLFFLAIGFAAHAATPKKSDSILLSAPNLYGKNFFTVLINSPDPKEAPKNFRLLTTQGADSLRASSSAVLSKGQLEYVVAKLNSDAVPGTLGEAKLIHVVDTSFHAHGFVNNMQVVWLDQNIQFGTDENAFYDQEKGLLQGLKKTKKLTLYRLPESVEDINFNLTEALKLGAQKIQVQADAVETEQEYLKAKKIAYTRIPIATNDLMKLEDNQIAQFVSLVRKMKKDEWLHFHNEEGATNLGLALLVTDILKNAPTSKLEDILSRQNGMSAQAKLVTRTTSTKLEQLYAYAKNQSPGFEKSFAAWNKLHKN